MKPIDHLGYLGGLIQAYIDTLPPVVAHSVGRDAQASLDAIKAELVPPPAPVHPPELMNNGG